MDVWAARAHRAIRAIRSESGQATTEYLLLTGLFVFGAGFVGLTFLPRFIRAFQMYFDSYYAILNLPIP